MSSSVNTINTQVRVQGSYSGSALDSTAPSGAITLTFPEAIRRALEFNLGKIGADAASLQAQAQRISVLSSLLPTVSASLSENAAKADLQAEGFNSSLFGSSLGFSFPNTVGPFITTTFAVRCSKAFLTSPGYIIIDLPGNQPMPPTWTRARRERKLCSQ